ncbi:MAG: type IV pilus assembly protein PilB [Candidatus Paceibacteria bacterium]|jgi:type II secretory ATPase GspE/PulE/Tfp pilus assembly ATPase PilB-like protein
MVDFDNTKQAKKIEEIRRKEEESFVTRIAEKFGLPYIDLTGITIETDALVTIEKSEAENAQLAPFKIVGRDLYVGIKSPNLPETKKALNLLEKDYNVGIHMVSTRSLEKAWERYADVSKATVLHGGLLDISPEEIKRIAEHVQTNQDIADEFDKIIGDKTNKKTTQLMEVIFGGAIATGSSDVHIEAQDEYVRLRFRQDGVLQDISSFDHKSYRKLLSRIKLVSKMKITQTQNAQDGRFTIDYDGKDIEVRVSVIPTAYGESFVMRILNPDGIKVGVENLGIEPRLYEILMKEIEKPNGMILNTGPTGSGKTTTLYSFMNRVYSPEVKILTIEDPIEYHLAGISQTQVNRAKGYDFLSGLRAALRQDPDIVMVGEIRDGETASIAINASLTGHLVLSTLHTNGAAGVIPRLIDLGVSPQILAAALSVSLAQRLVRKICKHCSSEELPTEEEETIIRNILKKAVENNKPLHEYGLSVDQKIILTKGRGCEKCNGTGYKGRIGIFEAIITDDAIEELLNKKPSEQEVRRVADKQGLLNMREDGVIKILNGTTSFEEVRKVVDLDIREVTQTQSAEIKKPSTIIDTAKVNPGAILTTKSVEISLLIDYLKKLEHEQMLNPEKDIAEQIKQVQTTILDLLEHSQAEELFNEKKDFAKTHKTFKRLSDDLAKLHAHAQKDPRMDMSQKIRRIREEIEHHEILKEV